MIGIGIYSILEAARLTKVKAPTIRRWVQGYSYSVQDQRRYSHPVWKPQLDQLDGADSIGFRDLMEIRFVNAFRQAGVSWKTLRAAAQKAADEFQTTHPFSQKRFMTDGKSVFELLEIGESNELRDILKDQYAFVRILSPFLRDIEFENDEPSRWRPAGFKKQVVIDPLKSFGKPITSKECVPTSVLFQAYEAEQDERRVAKWFEVALDSVRQAVAFERSLVS